MGPLLLGVVCLLLAWLAPLPYVLWIILTIVGVVLVLYGLYLLFAVHRASPGASRWTRWR